LPDRCVSLAAPTQQREDTNFILELLTARQEQATCGGDPQPFEEVVSLDVVGLPAGTYTVTVVSANSQSASFTLSVDNRLPTEPTPVPGTGTIEGLVWEDACQLQADGQPSPGCIAAEAGGYLADGSLDPSEARLAGVQVTLSAGECGAGGALAATATTQADGTYAFPNLQPGAYCVAVDSTSPVNAPLLQPGQWTYPAVGVGQATIILEAGATRAADFGWDPQAGSTAEGSPACQNQAAFMADVTIPDNTELAPASSFVKTWRVRNEGSCPWGPDYALVFAGGEQMGAPAEVPLSSQVAPGQAVDLSVPFIAPAEPGTYRSEWQLRDPQGQLFGSRGEFPFYVQIVVRGVEQN
jgi:hypothetical protein